MALHEKSEIPPTAVGGPCSPPATQSFFLRRKQKVLCYSAATPPKNEAGRLVVTHKAAPRSSTFEEERKKTMASHVSAPVREEKPHVTESRTNTIINALKRRAQAVLNDKSIDPQQRALIRYALEINDPWLAELVRRADAGENVFDTIDFLQTPEGIEDEVREEKIEALAEMICRADDKAAAALLVLMGMLENSTDPKVLANTVKHFAFTHCGESNLYRMVDTQ